jgi:hypothetical protein
MIPSRYPLSVVKLKARTTYRRDAENAEYRPSGLGALGVSAVDIFLLATANWQLAP